MGPNPIPATNMKDNIKENKKQKIIRENPFKETVGKTLTPKQLKFCEYYTSGDKEMFGNGTLSYMEVYDVSNYKVAQACASRLLSNAIICQEISRRLEIGGFNDENVEKQHLFLINQFSDLKTKRAALFDYYKLKGKFVERLRVEDLEGNSIFKEQTALLRKLAEQKDDDNPSEDIS